ERSSRSEQGGRRHFAIAKFMYALGESDLIEDLKRRGMNRVTPEFAVEIAMHLQQRDRHTSPRQQQPEHRSGGSPAGDTAPRRFNRHNRRSSRCHRDRCSLHLLARLKRNERENLILNAARKTSPLITLITLIETELWHSVSSVFISAISGRNSAPEAPDRIQNLASVRLGFALAEAVNLPDRSQRLRHHLAQFVKRG